MTAIKAEQHDIRVPPEAAQDYISQMLKELSFMAQSSGLKDLAALLRATAAASRVDLEIER